MYKSFSVAFLTFLTVFLSVFLLDIFPGDYVKKGIVCGVTLFLTEGTWAIYAVRQLVKKGQQEEQEQAEEQSKTA